VSKQAEDVAGRDDPQARVLGRKVLAVIEEIVRRIVAGQDDRRLRWWPRRKRVRVLIHKAFPDRQVRCAALHVALENRLKAAGWVWSHGRVLHTYERRAKSEDSAGASADRDGLS
jgi:hypothetical protein